MPSRAKTSRGFDEDNDAVDGVRKVGRQLRREGRDGGPGPGGPGHGPPWPRRSPPGQGQAHHRRLRPLVAPGPPGLPPLLRLDLPPLPGLWLADITYVWTWLRFFRRHQAHHRRLRPGRFFFRRVSKSLRTDLALDGGRRWPSSPGVTSTSSHLVHHPTAARSTLAIRYTELLAEEGGGRLGWIEGWNSPTMPSPRPSTGSTRPS